MTRRSFLLSAALILDASRPQALRLRSGQAEQVGVRPRDVRVGVFGLFHPTGLSVRSAEAGTLTLSARDDTSVLQGRELAELRVENQEIRIAHAGGVLRAPALRITSATGGPATLELTVPGRIIRTFRGRVEVRATAGELEAVIAIELETAVASVVAAEQMEATPLEALKAQAVASRSYFVASRGRHRGFDFCDTTHCQFLREPPRLSHPASRAARETGGLRLAFRGMPIAALYSASCGGRTRSLAEAGLRAEGYPFFAVDCDYCLRQAPVWQTRLPLDPETARLERERSEAARLAVARREGWSAVPGSTFAGTKEGNVLVLRGRGAGHGIGLCQAGAAALAADGVAFTHILQRYYPGTTLES